ncbi:MAG: pitrilysin family protein [Bacteroidales bacterium]|nr:pitrilysin family protein [Bacteroidales bacterium]MDZ4204177.1 pitrilysin family protein [Bacteroidales bacterium]
MKHLILITIALLFIFNAAAQQRKIDYVEYKLNNGLHVILHQDNTTPVVAVTVTYHVGSKNENADRTGFAHFMEHLMFEGSANIARGEYFKIVQDAGGRVNAYTSQDKTHYYELLPSNQLELGLWMEAERMLHLVIDSVGVETQRSVVKEERSQRYDNQPYGSFMEEIFKRAYKEHPYTWLPIGSVQYIDQASLGEFREFHKTYYVPNNAVLAIAGDIDIEKTKKLIHKYFADISAGKQPIVRPIVVEKPLDGEVRDIVYDNIQLPAVIQAYRIPEKGHPDSYALEMLTNIMSSGQSSRMYKSIVDEQQKGVAVFSFPFPLADPGLFIVLGITNMGVTADDLEKAINTEIEKLKKDGLSEMEFQKARNMAETQFVTNNSRVSTIADQLAEYYIFYDDANLINTEIDRYMKVSPDDILKIANKYLNDNNRVVLYYLPKSKI